MVIKYINSYYSACGRCGLLPERLRALLLPHLLPAFRGGAVKQPVHVGGRLQQADNFADEFVLALDFGQCYQVVVAQVTSPLMKAAFSTGFFRLSFRGWP